jgi:hypothetical protein
MDDDNDGNDDTFGYLGVKALLASVPHRHAFANGQSMGRIAGCPLQG